MAKKMMHLAFDLSWTQVESQWREPGSWVGKHYPEAGMFEDVARLAERGLFDMIFFGDGTGIPDTWKGGIDDAVFSGVAWPRLDMSPWITTMSRVTSHIGFGLTYASTFMHPFYVARLMNSLDHVTNGRMAFNVITSQRRSDYANYGYDELIDHGTRYERLEEFMHVCRALWDSVEPDAFLWDRDTGQVAQADKIHPIHHEGRFFKVKGPLNVVPSPQGRPVMIQAGGSPRGTQAAARVADYVFAMYRGLPTMVQQRADLDAALLAEGRDPEQVGIIFSTRAIVAETEREAQALKERMITGIPQAAVGVWLSHNTGFDMSTLAERFTLGELQQRIVAANASPAGFVHTLAQSHGWDAEITRDAFFEHALRTATGYALTFAGTAVQVADRLEEVFEATGSRGGFMLSHSQAAPRQLLHNVVDYLVPELQRRGRFRTAYTGRTLRENLGAMTLDQIVQSLVGGLAIGCIYSLVALGISMIIRATEIQHFAQGELLMIGAFAGLSSVWLGHLPFLAVLVIGMAGGGLIATVVELVAYRPLRARGVPLINVIIATLAVSLVLQNGARLVWGSEPSHFPALFGSAGISLLGVAIAPQMLWIVGLGLSMMVALQLFFRFTRLGLAMQAAAQDGATAQLMGISVSRVATYTFAIAGVMAGGAGVLLGSLFYASFSMGFGVAIKAFVAATLGGLGSVTGAMVGGLLFGLIETFGGLVISTAYKDALGMIVLIAVLLLAPSGLFGRAERRI